mgnify:CR=1 FL=1
MGFFWYESPWKQTVFMNLLNLCNLVYIGISEPFTTKQKVRTEYFNEACLGLFTYFLFLYTDFIPDEDVKYNLGWVQITIFGVNLLGNSYPIIKDIVNDTYLLAKKKFNLIKSKIKSRIP